MKGHDLVELDFDKKEEIFTGFTVQKLSGFAFILQKLKMEAHYLRRNFKGFFYRKAAGKRKHEIWLYNDRHGVIDNAYYLI